MSNAQSIQNPKTREATLDDLDSIYALAEQLADTVGDSTPDAGEVRARLKELLDEPRARIIVVEGEAGIVGVASLWIKPDLAHGDTVIEVPMLVVSEEARRDGIGRRLMSGIHEIAAGNDARLIELVATRANVAAQEFYRSLGFVEADVMPLEFLGDVEAPRDPEKGT